MEPGERGLARTVGADQGDARLGEGQGGLLENDDVTIRHGEADGDAVELDATHAASTSSRCSERWVPRRSGNAR